MSQVKVTVVVNAPVERIWGIIHKFDDLRWAHAPPVAITNGKAANEVGAVRQFHAGDKTLSETLVQYSEEPRSYSYTIHPTDCSLLPAPILRYKGTLSAEPVTDTNQTVVTWESSFYAGSQLETEQVHAFAHSLFENGLKHLKRAVEPKPKITYFPIRGRVELSRLLLEAAHVAYEDERLGPEFAERKATLPFGQLPVYSDEEIPLLAQSNAIAAHIARKYGLMGSSLAEAARIDMLVEAIRDLDDAAAKANSTGGDLLAAVSPLLSRLEGQFPSGAKYFVGSKPSLADLQLYNSLVNFLIPYVPTLADGFPQIKALLKRLADGVLKDYLDSDRRPGISLPPQYSPVLGDPEKCTHKF